MLPDRVSNPGPLTYKSGALPTALHRPAKALSIYSMELCLVIYLTKGGNWAIPLPPIFPTGYVSFATTFNTI